MPDIEKNLKEVRRRISEAADRSGRQAHEIELVCVTKTVGVPEIEALYQLGQRQFGENRIQHAREKIAQLPSLQAEWHMIGHLQRNKVKQALEMFQVLQSVDSLRLAEQISRRAKMLETRVPVYLEVNVSGEQSKYGVPLETGRGPDGKERMGLFDLVTKLVVLPELDLRGLMTMAPFVDDPEQVRPVFRRLRELRDEINQRELTVRPLAGLSMGMTNDFEVAIEEGATCVRIGSALFR
jgi:hypothetical protein